MKIVSRRTVFLVLAAGLVGVLGIVINKQDRITSPASGVSGEAETILARSTSVRSTMTPATSAASTAQTGSNEEHAAAGAPAADRPRFVSGAAPGQRRSGENNVALQHAQQGLRDYRQTFHQNPVGTNAEITRHLLGKNSRRTRFLPDAAHINSKGELTDRWDQPLFFHQISARLMEVRSAGPDHVMWNGDDEVLR